VSAASRANGKHSAAGGDDAAADSAGKDKARASRAKFEPVAVMLEHSRWRHLGWALVGLAMGMLLLARLGMVGQLAGLGLIAFALYRGYLFVRTLLVPGGTISVQPEQVELPRGLCRGQAEVFSSDQIRHAFLLRRSVPWTTTGPILVIEAGEHVFTYPRDWFLSEVDQHRIARAIHLLPHKRTES
jgi:hypothetical protein